MILSASTLRKHFNNIVAPFCERAVFEGMSYGLSIAGYDIRIREPLVLESGDFLLASSLELFNMPCNVMAFVKDKSTWARRGLAVQNTVIEPGWRGYLTLELTNHGPQRLAIQAGSPIAQIIFQLTDAVTDGYTGKYQDQGPQPHPARFE